jgi:hypothetical protein
MILQDSDLKRIVRDCYPLNISVIYDTGQAVLTLLKAGANIITMHYEKYSRAFYM